MGDIDSNLPIFSRATSAPVIISKDTSANATANPVYVQLSDGTNAVDITSGALDVNVDNTVTVSASQLDIDDLNSTDDEVAIGDGTNQLDLVVINSAFGATPTAMPVAGKYEATPTTYDDGDAVPLLTDANGRLLSSVTIPSGSQIEITDGTDTWSIDGSGYGQVDIAAQSVGSIAVSADNNANTETNPIFVQVVSGALSGIEVLDYDTSADVAADGIDNHDYTVPGSSTLKVQCCFGSASGAQKIEIKAGPVASLVSKAVQFTSMANPNWLVDFKGLLEVPDTSTGTLRIARKNRDEATMDVYSTLLGTLV